MEVVKKAIKPKSKGGLGLSMPIILRFPDVLHHRLSKLQSSFDGAIRAAHYDGCYRGVFPVKCNQARFVVENIVEFGRSFGFGLEAGSKPELLLAMASLCKGSTEALLVCNGYKDAEYICLALLARRIGLNCIIVLEQEKEVDLVLNVSRKLSIDPVIGMRAKLSTKHAGHFGDTSGEKGKFGLSCAEIISVVSKLRHAHKLHCLQLLHFHIGSQIPSLAILNDGVSEAAHLYCELALMGAAMKILDIGGGLGIDYDGTCSAQSDMSVGYRMEEYAVQVVQAVKSACSRKGVKHPILCSESGRAIVSHHSVFVFNVFSSSTGTNTQTEKGVALDVDDLPQELKDIHGRLISCAKACDYNGAFEHAKMLKHRCCALFKQGEFKLEHLAKINEIYNVMYEVMEKGKTGVNSAHMESNSVCADYGVGSRSADATYHINMSIFRSIPDLWAIGQLFPMIPIHRLLEEPTLRVTLSDLTCDSDGKVDRFIEKDSKGGKLNSLRVHELEQGRPYYMGMFLAGAYQEALGSLHNLFGAVASVAVWKNRSVKHGFKVVEINDGQTIGDVLRVMDYDPREIMRTFKLHMNKPPLHLDPHNPEQETTGFVHILQRALSSSTYLRSRRAT
ncbi:hypothetical protein KP509_1Z147000 [Ceratopteris richardii]|nr:hypothetical protein KP509_1Z147000 [Ceratopteris richardii]